jgi:hypothetical protein
LVRTYNDFREVFKKISSAIMKYIPLNKSPTGLLFKGVYKKEERLRRIH